MKSDCALEVKHSLVHEKGKLWKPWKRRKATKFNPSDYIAVNVFWTREKKVDNLAFNIRSSLMINSLALAYNGESLLKQSALENFQNYYWTRLTVYL